MSNQVVPVFLRGLDMYSVERFGAIEERLISAGHYGALSGCGYSIFPEILRVSIESVSCNNLHHSRTFVYLVLAALR